MKGIVLKLLISFVTLGCAALALFTAYSNAVTYSRTYDEPFHIDWNQRLLYEGETERESVYNYISTTPVLLLNVFLADTYEHYYPETKGKWRLFHLRFFTLFWLFLVLLFTFLLAKYIAGFYAGCLAEILISFEPTLIAHSSLATVDVAFAAITLVILYSTLKYSEKLSPYWALALGPLFGIAFCIKYTSFLLVPLPVLLPLVRHPLGYFRNRNIFALLCTTLLANYTINSFYLYKLIGLSLSEYHFFNEKFLWLQSQMPGLVLPFPRDFITGFDHLSEAAKRSEWNVIFLGDWSPQGSKWYFLVSWILKTPLAFIGMVVTSAILLLKNWKLHKDFGFLVVLTYFLFLFVYFSLFVKIQVGLRYLLMCLPLLSVLSAAIFFRVLSRELAFLTSAVIVFLCMLEVWPYRTNLISFSNSLIFQKKYAYKYLADSNIDWGQKRNDIGKHLQDLGVGWDRLNPPHILPGRNVITINHLTGVFWNFERYKWVRENLEPIKQIDHSLLVYDVSDSDFNRLMKSGHVAVPLHESSAYVSSPLNYNQLPIVPVHSTGQVLYVVFETAKETKIRIKATRGIAEIGQNDIEGACTPSALSEQQELWFQLEGNKRYLFCLAASDKNFEVTFYLQKGDIKGQAIFEKGMKLENIPVVEDQS